jgi:hypothetical protein
MRRVPRLLMAANGTWHGSFALMVNEPFAGLAFAAKNAGKQEFGSFLIFFNTLR